MNIGKLLFKLRFKFKRSTDISESSSYGYGKLDEYGFWQYPIFENNNKELKRTFISFKSKNQGPLIMIIEESWYQGKIIYGEVLFSTSDYNFVDNMKRKKG